MHYNLVLLLDLTQNTMELVLSYSSFNKSSLTLVYVYSLSVLAKKKCQWYLSFVITSLEHLFFDNLVTLYVYIARTCDYILFYFIINETET